MIYCTTLQEDLHYKVNLNTQCWEWMRSRKSDGYGNYRLKGHHTRFAHRISYLIHTGSIEEHQIVRHKCDNACCVNPDHLELGTHQDNMDDMVSRDRSLKGSKRPGSKLTEEQVITIKNHIRCKTKTNLELCVQYGMSSTLISHIKSGKRWGHISCD